jgi:hypothetical protein
MSTSSLQTEQLTKYTKHEYLLLGDLRAALNESDESRDMNWLLAVLDSLLETVPKEFELREEGGYLEDVVSMHPAWAPHVERLRSEHERIFEILAQLRRQVANQLNYTSLADQIQVELRDWMQLLIKHNRHERSLYQSAYNLDFGCGD